MRWRRYASWALPGGGGALPDPGRPDEDMDDPASVITAPGQPVERYVRDIHPRRDGVWVYRWEGVA